MELIFRQYLCLPLDPTSAVVFSLDLDSHHEDQLSAWEAMGLKKLTSEHLELFH